MHPPATRRRGGPPRAPRARPRSMAMFGQASVARERGFTKTWVCTYPLYPPIQLYTLSGEIVPYRLNYYRCLVSTYPTDAAPTLRRLGRLPYGRSGLCRVGASRRLNPNPNPNPNTKPNPDPNPSPSPNLEQERQRLSGELERTKAMLDAEVRLGLGLEC